MNQRSILFLEKVFLRPVPTPLRGVELFNIALIRDLLGLDYVVHLPAHPSWQPTFDARFERQAPDVHYGPMGRGMLTMMLSWCRRLPALQCRHLLLGNVGNGLIPLIHVLRWRRGFDRYVLIAHRETSRRFLRSLPPARGHVVAVNGTIAEPFRQAGFAGVHVDYGVMGAERYAPPAALRPDGETRFCVVGMLDNPWKGADTAVAAFRGLPEALRRRASLHLASFSEPPRYDDADIHAYPWMPAAAIPDWLRRMDVMICPSRDENVMRETFSQAAVQGMLTGLPMLASNLPILVEKLDEGGGAIFDDVPALTGQMADMIRNSERRRQWGRAARATALRRYVWDSRRFAQRYLETPPDAVPPDTTVLFIVGMPRSGTTALYRILARHPSVCTPTNASRKCPTHAVAIRVAGWLKTLEPREMGSAWDRLVSHDHDVMRAEDATVPRAAYARRLVEAHRRAYGKPVFVNKCPRLGMRIGFLHAVFPRARFLHLVRDGRAVARSVLEKRRIAGDEDAWWDVKPGNWRELQARSRVDALGAQWRDVVSAVCKQGAGLGADQYREIRYEDFTAAPVETVRDVLSWVGLDMDEDELAAGTAHIENRNHKWRESFTDTEADALTAAMRPMLERFGYLDDG